MESHYKIEDWLEGALEALARKGPEVVSIERLCAYLGVSRGSFYWHFKNRDVFIEQLVQFWFDKTTSAIANTVGDFDGTPADKLLFLAQQIVATEATRYDFAIRAWARLNPIAAAAVRRADRARYDVVRDLFAQAGFSGEELETRARTFIVYYSMETAISIRESKKDRLARIELRHRLLTRPC